MQKPTDISVLMTEWPSADDWYQCKRRALGTMGLTTVITPPDTEWKKKMLRARHSPIRYLRFSFNIWLPYCNSVHFARHVHAQPYISTQRNDRQHDYDRRKAPQDEMIYMIWDVNAEELMTCANKRLCGCADETTRRIMQIICAAVLEKCPEFKSELVPTCIHQGGCPEIFPCKGGPDLDF